jgi:hypothetical protein
MVGFCLRGFGTGSCVAKFLNGDLLFSKKSVKDYIVQQIQKNYKNRQDDATVSAVLWCVIDETEMGCLE